jgi:transcriptional regulator with XRE-family HTH domain
MKLSENLKNICQFKQITLSELSRRAQVPLSTLYAWTTGRRSINPMQLKQVAQVLEISIHELLFGGEDPHTLQEHKNIQKSIDELLNGQLQVTVYHIERPLSKK